MEAIATKMTGCLCQTTNWPVFVAEFLLWFKIECVIPFHTGRGAPRNTHTQIIEHTAVNGSVHTACKQHQIVCMQICVQMCLCVLCERGPSRTWTFWPKMKQVPLGTLSHFGFQRLAPSSFAVAHSERYILETNRWQGTQRHFLEAYLCVLKELNSWHFPGEEWNILEYNFACFLSLQLD